MSSSFYFVNQNKDLGYDSIEVEPTEEQKEFMQNLIVETYEKIKNRVFTPGCGKKDCEWCNYVSSGAVVKLEEDEDEESEDF